MSRVFVSGRTSAAVYVFSDDHCPPHVHARHRGDGWVARVAFSFLSPDVSLLSVRPVTEAPNRRVLQRLVDDVRTHVALCRVAWWGTLGRTCLEGQWFHTPAADLPAARIEAAGYDTTTGGLVLLLDNGNRVGIDPTTETVG